MNKQELSKTQLEFIEHLKSVRNPYYYDTDEFLITFSFVLNEAKSQSIAEHDENVKPITDHELSIIAHEWHKNLDTHFTGHKFAFAHGYRAAERRLLPAPYQPKEGGKR